MYFHLFILISLKDLFLFIIIIKVMRDKQDIALSFPSASFVVGILNSFPNALEV